MIRKENEAAMEALNDAYDRQFDPVKRAKHRARQEVENKRSEQLKPRMRGPKRLRRAKEWDWGSLEVSSLSVVAAKFCQHGAEVLLEQMKDDIREHSYPVFTKRGSKWVLSITLLASDDMAGEFEFECPLETLLNNTGELKGDDLSRELAGLISKKLTPDV